jgi:hypothetical protein
MSSDHEVEQPKKKIKFDLKSLGKINNNKRQIIYKLRIEIDKIRSEISENEKIIFKNCTHEWIRDMNEYDPCRTPKICKHCNMSPYGCY